MQIPQETKLSDSFPRTTWSLHLISVSSLVLRQGFKDVSFENPLKVAKGARHFFLTPQA